MPPPADMNQAFVLPKVKYCFKTTNETDRLVFYDVKFYPYAGTLNLEPVFAVVAQTKVYFGRVSNETDAIVTMLHEIQDEQESRNRDSSGLNSCSWCYVDPQQPLLAVAGGSGQLKVIDAVRGERFTTLIGHGHGTINDIATHPIYPWIVATASMDKSLRIWDLRRHNFRHESPTIVICGQASGHSEGILTVSWHATGRYLISGGLDNRICVWTVPDLDDESPFWREIAPENRKRSSQEVKIIHFPHFTTSAIHHDFVDCVKFFGDLVLSKAANENKLVLWKMTGFDTRSPPPDSATAPKTEGYLDTRNGFMRTATGDKNSVETVKIAPEFLDQPPYQRLLEFDSPNSKTFYMRFGLLLPSPDFPDLHPALVFGNETTEVRFWDLQRLSLGFAGGLDENKPTAPRRKKGAAARFNRANVAPAGEMDSPSLVRESTVSSASNISLGPWPARQTSTEATSEISDDLPANGSNPPFPVPNRKRYPLHDPHQPIKPHERLKLIELQYKQQKGFFARAADWSPCGRWCIVVGESQISENEGWGGFAVLHR
ncbi:hypothetical protein H2200_010039 [Cladophialophora chaetospira]|uniref:Polycomb protein EED n=1 Tax=Cladophialophora chaetospira TaxID=386627 RepID=A0AA38X252_9EURO|nr:hypothetical protein H2200_010039 [Cladophialophora chaetospira]